MATVTVGNLVDVIRQQRLLKPAQLDELPPLLQRFPEPQAFVKELQRRGWLTAFQGRQLLFGASVALGPYILLERLGEGGMGQVFKGRHQSLDRVVALKVLRKELLVDSEAVGRFYREVEVVSQLSHPAIVHAYDAGIVGTVHYLALEYIEGIDLDRMVKEKGRLQVAQACEYIRQAALGLQHAHERGLIHRDIKPSNLLVAKGSRGGLGIIKILDLGLARLQQPMASSRTSNLTVIGGNAALQGTPDYLAPEQALDFHNVDIRADIYSLGCTFYYLLAAQPPFGTGSLSQKLIRHQQAEAQPIEKLREDVPPEVARILQKMLAKRPPERYQTPGEVAKELAALSLLQSLPASDSSDSTMSLDVPSTQFADMSAPPSSAAAGAGAKPFSQRLSFGVTGWRSRRRLLAAAGAALLCLIVGVFLLYALSSSSSPSADGKGSSGKIAVKPTEPVSRTVLQFNGANNLVVLPDNLFRQSQALTVEAWFKTGTGGAILGYQNSAYPTNPGSHVPVLYIGTDGLLRGEFWNGGANPIATMAPVNDSRWHHVCLVADGPAKMQTLYLDGNPVGTRPGDINHLDMKGNQIGMAFTPGWAGGKNGWYGFSGNIAEVRIWHVARTLAEIQKTKDKPLAGNEPGLAAYYPLDEAGGNIALDRSPQNRKATLPGDTPANKLTRTSVPPFLR